MKNCRSTIVKALALAAAAVTVQACDLTLRGPASTRPPIAPFTGSRIQQSEKSAQPNRLSSSDWSSIRQEHLRRQQAAFPVEGGWRARNYHQNWSAFFDGRGFEITPDDGSWRWGLKLTSYGYQGQERRVDKARSAADGEKFSYQWDSILREWYVNGESVEHGYSVAVRPGNGAGLRFRLEVLGTLQPRVAPDGRSVTFVEREGAARVINYGGLKVTDAAGRQLGARFLNEDSGLRLEIDDADAQYPITVDPMIQLAYLKASNAAVGDEFGYSVAVDGDVAVVGAPYEDGNGTSPSDNSVSAAGAAYVFWRNPSGAWTEVSYLKAPNPDPSDLFGYSVGVSHNSLGDVRVVVGAWGEDGPRDVGVVNPSSNVSHDSGAAYVFKLSPTACGITPPVCPPVDWPLEQYLKGRWLRPDDHFSIVAIRGDTIVVGAFNDDDFDEGDPDVGAAYVFTIDSTVPGSVWTQDAYLKPPCFCLGHEFGLSVGISEDEQTVIVGAWRDSIGTLSKAYVFTRAGTAWNWQATLQQPTQPPNQTANSYFGFSVGISGDTVVVGAPAAAFDNGRAYIFKRSLKGLPSWTLEGTLIPDPNSRAFGWSAAISGDTAVVGAPRSTLTGTGYGELYAFTRPPLGSAWSQQDHFQTSNFQDGFGSSVALSGSTVVVGAFEESGNSLSHSGAAYVFGPAVTLTTISIVAPTTMVLGTSEQFTAEGTYSDGTHADLTNQVTWKSSTSAVTFSTPGLATGAALGPSDITASMSGVVSNTVALTVTAPVLTGISIEPTSLVGPFASPLYLTVGASEQLKATGHYSDGSSANLTNQVIWQSTTSAVTISNSTAGLVTGAIAGSGQITASMSGVTSNVVPVIVRTFIIEISAPNNTIPVGSSEALTAMVRYSDNATTNVTNQVAWNSSGGAVTISAAGVATGAGGGNSVITASMSGVISNAIDLRVVQAVSRTLLSASENSVSRGQAVTFTVDVLCSCTVVPHGQVVFKDYGVNLPAGTSTLVNGHATLDVTTLSIGRHSITATFIENSDFFSSTSGTVDILVVGASGLDESSGTAVRAILIGSVSGQPIGPEDTISGSFGGNASAQTDDILNVGYSAAHSSLSPVATPGGSLSFGPSVGAYARGDSGPICARSCTRGTGAGRAISYAKYRNDTQSVQTFQVSGIIDGRFSSNSISASGHVTAMVYVFDQDEFLNTIDTSGQSMPQFLLGRDTLDDYATANASTLPLTRLFPSVITTSEFRVLTAGSPNLPLQTGLTSVGPGHAVIVVLDISAFQPPGGIVDYFTTLKPAPVFLTDPAGNPSPMTAVGPWAPATPAAVNLTLTPAATTNPITTSVTLTATATTGAGAPVPDTTVYWQITSGPNAQQLGPAKTGVNGKASLTYTGGAGAGTDLIQANIESLTSNLAAITWTTPGPLDHISISPASATVAAGATQAYTAAGLDLFDHSTGDVTANTVFSISPDGSCTGTTCTASVAGTHTITGTYAGKTATAALEVTGSSSFTFQGFFQPIDMSTTSLVVWNTVKGGQAVPVKWLLTLNGAPVSEAASFAGLSSYPVACSSGAGAIDEAIEESAAGSSGLQYNGSGNWQFNWKTLSSYKNACRAVVVKFTDGTTSPAVNFKFK